MMDMLMLWVTIGYLVEATRIAVQKCCWRKKKENGDSSDLSVPLLNPEEALDASGHCRLSCCAHRSEYVHPDGLEESEYSLELSEEEIESLCSLRAITTDDSEEDLDEQRLKIIEWDISTATPNGDKISSSLKGKEIVEELEDDTRRTGRSRSEAIPSSIRIESRRKNSAKIYPEPLNPPFTGLQASNSNMTHAGKISPDNGLKIYDQSSWDRHFKANPKIPTAVGECSKS